MPLDAISWQAMPADDFAPSMHAGRRAQYHHALRHAAPRRPLARSVAIMRHALMMKIYNILDAFIGRADEIFSSASGDDIDAVIKVIIESRPLPLY